LYYVPRVAEAAPSSSPTSPRHVATSPRGSGSSSLSGGGGGTAKSIAASVAAADQKLIVRRRTDSSLPSIENGNAHSIRWQETFYLNVVLHHMLYILTVSIHTTDAGYSLVKKVYH
jgi:shikimate 5-dehydrogenase